MGLFDMGKKAREEQARREAEEAERKRKAAQRKREEAAAEAERQRKEAEEAEEAERKRRREEARKKREAEEAERRCKEEDERKRKEAEEAERKRKAKEEMDRIVAEAREEARRRKEAEEAERKRKEEEKEAERKRMEEDRKRKEAEEAECKRIEEEKDAQEQQSLYEKLQLHTPVNCKVLAEAGYRCNDFDDWAYTAIISPMKEYIDFSYRRFPTYEYDKDEDGNLEIVSDIKKTTLAFDLRMCMINGELTFCPRMLIEVYQRDVSSGDIYIRIGENRYFSTANFDYFQDSPYHSWAGHSSTIVPLGAADIAVLYEIVTEKYDSGICPPQGIYRDFSENDIADIRSFLDVCNRAGVFDQSVFKALPSNFKVITKFNP